MTETVKQHKHFWKVAPDEESDGVGPRFDALMFTDGACAVLDAESGCICMFCLTWEDAVTEAQRRADFS